MNVFKLIFSLVWGISFFYSLPSVASQYGLSTKLAPLKSTDSESADKENWHSYNPSSKKKSSKFIIHNSSAYNREAHTHLDSQTHRKFLITDSNVYRQVVCANEKPPVQLLRPQSQTNDTLLKEELKFFEAYKKYRLEIESDDQKCDEMLRRRPLSQQAQYTRGSQKGGIGNGPLWKWYADRFKSDPQSSEGSSTIDLHELMMTEVKSKHTATIIDESYKSTWTKSPTLTDKAQAGGEDDFLLCDE